MDRVLVTGATGLVGNNIARELLRQGRRVRALVRSPQRAARVLPSQVELVPGDVTDRAAVDRALAGCAVVYHAAGPPEQWLRDPSTFDRVHVDGTRNLLAAARAAGVRRLVYTSTIDVFAARPGAEFDEREIDPAPRATPYERAKQRAYRLVEQAIGEGLPAVTLHPAAVYGPGPATSPGLNGLMVNLVRSRLPLLIPGGVPVVYSLDVAGGHLLAEARAPIGSRSILCDRYVELSEFARTVVRTAGRGFVPPVMPYAAARLAAAATEALAAATRLRPLVPRGQLHFAQWGARPSAARARRELGWTPIPFELGVELTLAFLRRSGQLPG